MEKVLVYADSREGSAVVVEVSGHDVETIREQVGDDVENWPSDFGIYDKGDGLYVWEGQSGHDDDGDYTLTGQTRELNPSEWQRAQENRRILD